MQGKVDYIDIQAYFMKLGIPVDPDEAKHLLRRIDRNNNDCIEYEEWRKFLLFLPISNIASVTQFWRHGAVSSDFLVIFLSSDLLVFYNFFRFLISQWILLSPFPNS